MKIQTDALLNHIVNTDDGLEIFKQFVREGFRYGWLEPEQLGVVSDIDVEQMIDDAVQDSLEAELKQAREEWEEERRNSDEVLDDAYRKAEWQHDLEKHGGPVAFCTVGACGVLNGAGV